MSDFLSSSGQTPETRFTYNEPERKNEKKFISLYEKRQMDKLKAKNAEVNMQTKSEVIKRLSDIKMEPDETNDNGYALSFSGAGSSNTSFSNNNFFNDVNMKSIKVESLVKTEIKREGEDTDPPIFTTDMLQNSSFNALMPKEETSESTTLESRKSAKKSVFLRLGPYETPPTDGDGPSRFVTQTNGSIKNIEKIDRGKKYGNRSRTSVGETLESDPETLARRQKQIDYGKNTVGYDNYTQIVPRNKRSEEDPKTPNKFNKYSRRAWDGLIKQWRIKLHKYDPEALESSEVEMDEKGIILGLENV